MYPFIGLVGPSGSGKTTLIMEAIRALPDQVTMMRSVTTRPRRGPEDVASYTFVTGEEILKRHTEGHLVNLSEYANNLYAFDRRVLDATLTTRIGIQALVESAIQPLRQAGYNLHIVRIIPEGTIDQRDPVRIIADQERTKDSPKADLTINNRFIPGGREAAAEAFIAYLKALIV